MCLDCVCGNPNVLPFLDQMLFNWRLSYQLYHICSLCFFIERNVCRSTHRAVSMFTNCYSLTCVCTTSINNKTCVMHNVSISLIGTSRYLHVCACTQINNGISNEPHFDTIFCAILKATHDILRDKRSDTRYFARYAKRHAIFTTIYRRLGYLQKGDILW